MAYSRYHKGTKYNHDGTAWRKIAMWSDAETVEVDGAAIQSNLPAAFGGATTLHNFLAQIDTSFGAASGFATLDGTGKLTASQLPAAVAGGLTYSGAWNAAADTLDDLATMLGGTTGDTGKYVVVTTAGTISDTVTTAKWEANTYDDGEAVNGAVLEVGDWILCTSYTTHHNFSVISNTYGDATTTAKGITRLSDATTRAGLSGDDVITEGVLSTILNGDILVDGDFASAGFMKTNGSGVYSVDNSTYLTQTSFNSGNNELSAIQALADTAGFLKKTGDGTYTIDTSTYLTSETSHSDVLVDGDFATAGLMTTNGAGVYSITAASTFQTKITVDAGAPSGGAANDLWIVTS